MFETHKLNDKGFSDVSTAKSIMNKAVLEVLDHMPEGRDKSIFITKIEEAMFFGTRALAAKEGNYTEIVRYGEQ